MRVKKQTIFVILLMALFCGSLWLGGQEAHADGWSFSIEAFVNYSISGCSVSGDEVICSFSIKPQENLTKASYTGQPPRQDMQIDVTPKGSYGMTALKDKYLGYWHYSENASQLLDIQNPTYSLKIDKSKLKKQENKGDVTVITYTGQFCFDVDVHWREYGYNNVTHGGDSNFCGDFSVQERIPSEFKGKSSVGSTTTGWVNATIPPKLKVINDCAADGCDVKFVHSLERTAGYGASSYEIKRTSNYSRLGVNGKTLKTGSENFNNGSEREEYSETVKLVPGQVVCEEMRFRINSNNEYRTTTVCAMALGNVKSTIEQKVANSSVGKYSDMQALVYAKPGDTLIYETTYNPAVQYAYYLGAQRVKIDNGAIINPYSFLSTLGSAFNYYKGSGLGTWHNSFTVSGDKISLFRNYYEDEKYNGDTTGRIERNNYEVSNPVDVGRELTVVAETNLNDSTKTTPSEISFVKYKDGEKYYSLGNVKTNRIWGSASALVPYNFVNKTEISSIDQLVYAGETANIAYKVVTELKENNLLEDTYATVAKNAKWKMEICYGNDYENCYWSEEKTGNLHEKEDIWDESTKEDDSTKTQIVVPDVPAGTKIWVRSAVYPKDSGGDDNIKPDYYDPNDPNSWAYSDWAELTVAKKPSFQVWGGSIYSAGNISVNTSEKQHVFGVNNFEEVLKSKNNTSYIFGPWTELGLVASGSVVGLASGAGTGYAEASDALSVPIPDEHLGGSEEWDVNYCLRSTLSFANSNCNSSVGGLSGVSQGDNREALIARFVEDGGSDINRVDLDGDLDSVIVESGTNLYYKDGDLRIAGDVVYGDAVYSTLAEIPKTIIYSTGNIVIDCGVKRIDAVLIAKGDINTCPTDVIDGQEDRDNKDNSTPLKINGSTISDTLTLNRTYGTATGVNTVVPAEVINYDTTLYLWANGKSDVTRTGKIVTTYQKELSPRY
ncbi:hypothetical protein IJG11_02570 [Candidatus Saccharibacteria bacterium]|nr:hypothetical protein [Candidatus Saccharibacteria bacterium]